MVGAVPEYTPERRFDQWSRGPAWLDVHKMFRSGTHRTVDPSETLQRVLPHLARLGITRIANVTGLDVIGIPVVMVCRPNSRSISVAQGKGATLDAAKASGIMEALETQHAECIEHSLRVASYTSLWEAVRLADVRRLPQSIGSQFHDDLEIPWIEGFDIASGMTVWLPYEIVHTDYSLPLVPGSGCFPANTNGLASGNHHLEAISHGICEAIERDAVTLWKRQSEADRKALVIDPASIDDNLCQDLLARYRNADIDVRIWDATSDIGVATFYCMILGDQPGFADPEFGAGCHPSRAIALARALTEAAQARTTFIAGARDDFLSKLYAEENRSRRLRQCRMIVTYHHPIRAFHSTPTYEGKTLGEDVSWLIERLAARGLEQVIVVDLTRPEFGVPVVKVVIPGLEGPDKGLGSDYVPGARARAICEGP